MTADHHSLWRSPFASLGQKVVLVTGAYQGIGAAIRDAFQAVGAIVIAADLEWAHETLRREPEGHWSVHLDVTQESEIAAVLDQVEATHGKVEILVNSAGISTMSPVVTTTLDDWQLNHDVNTVGSFITARAVVSRLAHGGAGGRIIFIASQAGKNGYRGMGAYVASKHAVLGLTKTLALEVAAQGVTVNAVCPGIIETRMKRRERIEGAALRDLTAADIEREDQSQVPLGRTGVPEDVAGVCLFLASDLASYMTGQGINVTGGMTM